MKRYVRNVTIQQIEAFIRLAEERSFSGAAKIMYLTQPSVSKHIRRLEEIVGSPVVERTSSGIELTAEGRVVLDYGRKVLRKLEEMEERVALVRDSDRGSISVAASTIPATYILPVVLGGFRNEHPRIRCFVRMNDSSGVLDMVLEGESELGFVGSGPSNKKLVYEALWKDVLLLVVPKEHRWWKRRSVSWDEIFREPFVSREAGSATRETLEQYLFGRGRDPASLNVVAEMGSSESVKEAVAAGMGISVLSRYAVRRDCDGGSLVCLAVDGPPMERVFSVVYRKRFSLQRHHRLFLDYVRGVTWPPE